MSIHNTQCCVCNVETTKREYNEYYEQWDAVCYDRLCEKQYHATTTNQEVSQ